MQPTATSLLLASTLLLGATSASAQTTFRLGVRGGANRALTTQSAAGNYTENVGSYTNTFSADKSAMYSWQAGLAFEAGFGKISLQPALVFTQKGETAHTIADGQSSAYYSFGYTEETSTNRYNWLELPLNVVYTPHGDHGFQVFAGPYVALAVGGHRTGTLYNNSNGVRGPVTYPIDERITYGSKTNNRRLDAGVNFGIGYRQGPMQLQLGYSLGLRNLHQANASPVYVDNLTPTHDFTADAAYNRVAQLTGTYFFSL
jgi:hypothetical protein